MSGTFDHRPRFWQVKAPLVRGSLSGQSLGEDTRLASLLHTPVGHLIRTPKWGLVSCSEDSWSWRGARHATNTREPGGWRTNIRKQHDNPGLLRRSNTPRQWNRRTCFPARSPPTVAEAADGRISRNHASTNGLSPPFPVATGFGERYTCIGAAPALPTIIV